MAYFGAGVPAPPAVAAPAAAPFVHRPSLMDTATMAADAAGTIFATSLRIHDGNRLRNGMLANLRLMVDSDRIADCWFFLVPMGPNAAGLSATQWFKGSAAEYERRLTAGGVANPTPRGLSWWDKPTE